MSFIQQHGGVGILTPEDVPDLQNAVKEAFAILMDGQWHSGQEIKERHRHGQGEALRRVRDLRPILKGLGYAVEQRRGEKGELGGPRMFYYRIAKLPEEPFTLEFTS
jgi:hypothetical protein